MIDWELNLQIYNRKKLNGRVSIIMANCKSVKQSVNYSINQLVNQTVNRSANQLKIVIERANLKVGACN